MTPNYEDAVLRLGTIGILAIAGVLCVVTALTALIVYELAL